MNNNLENFKKFVKNNSNFASYIKDGTMTWQKFYELYDMYGEDSDIWKEYKETKKSPTISEIVSIAKKIDIDKLQEGVNSLSKAVGLFSELFSQKKTGTTELNYKPRAIYKRFED